jgi:hypothetical protein
MTAGAESRAGWQTVDHVQPGKIVGRRGAPWGEGHLGESHIGVAPGTGGISVGVGVSRAVRTTWHTLQGVSEKMVTAEHGQGCSISRSSLQVPLSAEQEGFMRLTSSRATTIKDRKVGCIIL